MHCASLQCLQYLIRQSHHVSRQHILHSMCTRRDAAIRSRGPPPPFRTNLAGGRNQPVLLCLGFLPFCHCLQTKARNKGMSYNVNTDSKETSFRSELVLLLCERNCVQIFEALRSAFLKQHKYTVFVIIMGRTMFHSRAGQAMSCVRATFVASEK